MKATISTYVDSIDDYDFYDLCPVCGVELNWVDCWICHGEGGRDNDSLMDEDPLWYDGVEWEICTECDGKGGWQTCLNAKNHPCQRRGVNYENTEGHAGASPPSPGRGQGAIRMMTQEEWLKSYQRDQEDVDT